MKYIKTAVVAMCVATGVLYAAECGTVTKKTYKDDNCKELMKEEELPAKDSRLCQDPDNSPKNSYMIHCETNMILFEYDKPNCTGEFREVAQSPPNRCVKDLDTDLHVVLSWTG